jgi:hypothetical protein
VTVVADTFCARCGITRRRLDLDWPHHCSPDTVRRVQELGVRGSCAESHELIAKNHGPAAVAYMLDLRLMGALNGET